jgi:CDGSH-type Zn-finger protein
VTERSKPRIKVVEDGPYRVTGAPVVRMRKVVDDDTDVARWERGPVLLAGGEGAHDLCRCGQSGTKPFCDGVEKTIGFDGTETADRGPTAGRRSEYGDVPVVLSDDRTLCARAAFCETRLTDAWTLAQQSEDPQRRGMLTRMVERCPSGRLAYHVPPDPAALEEELPQEIAVVDDGPLWVRGGIPIEAADGFEYEVRNRVALCRCGQSKNKPFCDGSHVRARFTDRGDWSDASP